MSNNRISSDTVDLCYGCHLSLRGGYAQASKQAIQLQEQAGLGCYQYFSKNPRSLSVKAGFESDALSARGYGEKYNIRSVAHTPYPTNLAVDADESPELFRATVQSLLNDLMIAEACGSVGAVVHFGAYKGSRVAADKAVLRGYENIIRTLNTVLNVWSGQALLLIENQAGNHGGMGATLEELVQIRKLSSCPSAVGFCFDTCHAYASGLWNPSETKALLSQGNALDYWSHVHAVHLNDARDGYASRKDRHANVGQGCIGMEAFDQLLSTDEMQGKMFILETPGDGNGRHNSEWEALRHGLGRREKR
ncbi:deoxyribonuclease IV [Paenibacillus sp. MER TA 81-3]|uniref:deoxyribonuclease IV n=1 Tax=Paenibacillus sp. MER TA 81-3 TaxID=2939573 RepID=UPI0020418511|nr:deoxyribonuclease IV [Paenibacillus sp. MER TA 81-3]MCM3339929.1 deoxyribonuclease IV [Paenibacillus sp. MER TA 81-3]